MRKISDDIVFMDVSTIDYPGHISIIIYVAQCQMSCNYCYNIGRLQETSERISVDKIEEELLKGVGFYDALTICGGEPSLYEDLPEFIQYFKKKHGLYVKVDTNGHNFNRVKDADYVALDYKWPINLYKQYGRALPNDLQIALANIGQTIPGVVRSVVTLVHDNLDKLMYNELKQCNCKAKWEIHKFFDNEFINRPEEIRLYNDKLSEKYDIIFRRFLRVSAKFNGEL